MGGHVRHKFSYSSFLSWSLQCFLHFRQLDVLCGFPGSERLDWHLAPRDPRPVLKVWLLPLRLPALHPIRWNQPGFHHPQHKLVLSRRARSRHWPMWTGTLLSVAALGHRINLPEIRKGKVRKETIIDYAELLNLNWLLYFQLEWFDQQLRNAIEETPNNRVVISAHVPPGFFERDPSFGVYMKVSGQ